MSVMVVAGARSASAQITEKVAMADPNSDFEFYDQVNGVGCPQDGTISNNGPSDPNFARDQFCSTSIIRAGDKVQWNSPPVALGVGPHGTRTGTCGTTTCTGIPSNSLPDWDDGNAGQNPGDPAFTVPPGCTAGSPTCIVNNSFTFNTAGVYPYFCTVHTV